jgi:hypothetical protein
MMNANAAAMSHMHHTQPARSDQAHPVHRAGAAAVGGSTGAMAGAVTGAVLGSALGPVGAGLGFAIGFTGGLFGGAAVAVDQADRLLR